MNYVMINYPKGHPVIDEAIYEGELAACRDAMEAKAKEFEREGLYNHTGLETYKAKFFRREFWDKSGTWAKEIVIVQGLCKGTIKNY